MFLTSKLMIKYFHTQLITSTNLLVYPRRSFRSLATKAQQISLFNEVESSPKTAVIAFDTETTGLSPHKDRIIEIAARDLQGHGRNSTFETLINPEIPVKNSRVHGITTQMVCKPEIPRFKEMVPKLVKFVNDRRMDRKHVLLVAHNARRFDVPFLVKEFQRCSMEVPSNWLFLDTLPLARQLVKHDGRKLASVSMRALRELYDEIRLTGQEHRAMHDVNALCDLLKLITMRLELTADTDLLRLAFSVSDLISPMQTSHH